jgi:hypothetical protein
VVSGYFSGAVDFGGGALTSAGGSDIFLAKFTGAGGHLWSKGFGSSPGDMGNGVVTDAGDNIVLIGTVPGMVNFGGVWLQGSGKALCVAKFSSTGAHLWSKRANSAQGNTDGCAVTADSQGNVFAIGNYQYTVDFGGAALTAPWGSTDGFLLKFAQ